MLSSEANTARAIITDRVDACATDNFATNTVDAEEKIPSCEKIVCLCVRLCNTHHHKKHSTLYQAYSKQRKNFSIRCVCLWQLQNTSETRIRSNWNYEMFVFKGSYGKTGVPGVNPQWGKGENPKTTNSTYIRRPLRDLNPGHMHWWKASVLATSSPLTSWVLLKRLKPEIKTVRQKVDDNSWGFLSLGCPSEMIYMVRDFADQGAPSPHIFNFLLQCTLIVL